MDHPLQASDALIRPWRTATVVAVAIAGIELVLLVIVVGTLLARPGSDGETAPARQKAAQKSPAAATKATTARAAAAKAATKTPPVPKPELGRRQVSVLVLNGNGRQGAAAEAAARVKSRGYTIRAVANASRHDYARSMIMYRAGFAGEAHRLGRDLGVKQVGPLDGLRVGQLDGAHAVLVLGR